ASLNPYRGCEHGCIYCYARPTHEYLGFSAGLDFETRILVKEDAPELLRRELMAKKWTPQTLAMSGVTDPYQPVERKLEITRRCLAVLAEFCNPVAVITKNALVTRDIDHHAARRRRRPRDGAARLAPARQAGSGGTAERRGHPDRRDGGAGGAGDHRSRDAEDPGSRRRRGSTQRGLRDDAPARRRLGSVRRMAGTAFPGPQGQGAPPRAGAARRQAQRSALRQPDARRRGLRRPDPLHLPDLPPPLRPGPALPHPLHRRLPPARRADVAVRALIRT